MENLLSHVRNYHTQDKLVQTDGRDYDDKATQFDLYREEHELYQCYYCTKVIESETDLTEHRGKCHGASKTPSLFSLPVRPPAPIRPPAPVKSETRLTVSTNFPIEREHCDFCDMECNTLGELINHMRCQHKHILPS